MQSQSFNRRLREKRLVQTNLAYLGLAWFVMQLGDVLAERWGVTEGALRLVDLSLVVGLPIALMTPTNGRDTNRLLR